nr:MAG TPA: hypothetical protein [Caudoviricetes sp.]
MNSIFSVSKFISVFLQINYSSTIIIIPIFIPLSMDEVKIQ